MADIKKTENTRITLQRRNNAFVGVKTEEITFRNTFRPDMLFSRKIPAHVAARLRSFPSIALRIPTAHNFTRG